MVKKREILFTTSVKMVAEVGEKVAEGLGQHWISFGGGEGKGSTETSLQVLFSEFPRKWQQKKKKIESGIVVYFSFFCHAYLAWR